MISAFDLIVVTADEPYQGLAHTQILYTNFFAKQKQVLYLEAPHKWRPWHILRSFKNPTQQHSNLFVHTYINALPSKLKLGKIINERLNERVIARFLKKRNAKNTLVWHFDSYRSVLNGTALQAQSQLQHIYHVIDPFYNNPVDAQLRAISKVVVVTSPRNLAFYDNVKSKVLQVPQCVDLTAEKVHLRESSTLANLPENYLVLLGTLSDDTDFELLLQIAEAQIHLLIIGKTVVFKKKQKDFEAVQAHPNIHFTGLLTPPEFYPLLKKAAAGLIAYDLSIRSRSFSPLKAINYLIAGLPIISNCSTEIVELQGAGVYETIDQKEYLKYCSQALQRLAIDLPKVDAFLDTISLERAVSRILQMP